MKKASSSLLLLFFALLFVSLQSYAQSPRGPRPQQPSQGSGQLPGYYEPLPQSPQSEMIHEEVRQTIRGYQRLSLAQALRLSYGEENSTEIVSLSVRAQSLMNGPAQLEIMQNGRLLSSQTVRRNSNEIFFSVPLRTLVGGLELSAVSDIYIETITAQVQRSYNPNPYPGPGREQQVSPNQLITLVVNQQVRSYGLIDLDRLARQQMGLTLSGAQIERVVVQGQPLYSGRATSVQVELNGRLASDAKYLSSAQAQLPLPVSSLEEVRQLSLRVNGDADIREIRIRVGQVRPQGPQYPGPQNPGPQYPGQTQRVYVQQEVSSRYPLSLSSLLPYESRMIRLVTIEARSRVGQSQLILSAIYSGQQGAIVVNQNSARATIRLARPMSASELQLMTSSVVQVEALEIEFDQYYR